METLARQKQIKMSDAAFLMKARTLNSFYSIYKKFLFLLDAEKVHRAHVKLGKNLGDFGVSRKLFSLIFDYEDSCLEQTFFGIRFRNPVGLAAGFDYDGELTQIIPKIGFGFQTIGSLTFRGYEGNPAPRLERLPNSKSLLVNKGLKNSGAKNILDSLQKLNFEIPLGISVAKTNCRENAETENGINDYVNCFKVCENSKVGDFYELNISCPNVFGGEPFTTPKKLEKLLAELKKLKIKKPIFIKMPVDLSMRETAALCDVAAKYDVNGLIFGNLTKDRKSKVFDRQEIKKARKGNFSGLPTYEKSNELISFAYKKYGEKFLIIGCGGIFSAEDAYEKIKNGASLIQMITGMIFNGPQVIGQINYGLSMLLKKDGFASISEAVGSAHMKRKFINKFD